MARHFAGFICLPTAGFRRWPVIHPGPAAQRQFRSLRTSQKNITAWHEIYFAFCAEIPCR